jgi:hypothetical protein
MGSLYSVPVTSFAQQTDYNTVFLRSMTIGAVMIIHSHVLLPGQRSRINPAFVATARGISATDMNFANSIAKPYLAVDRDSLYLYTPGQGTVSCEKPSP